MWSGAALLRSGGETCRPLIYRSWMLWSERLICMRRRRSPLLPDVFFQCCMVANWIELNADIYCGGGVGIYTLDWHTHAPAHCAALAGRWCGSPIGTMLLTTASGH